MAFGAYGIYRAFDKHTSVVVEMPKSLAGRESSVAIVLDSSKDLQELKAEYQLTMNPKLEMKAQMQTQLQQVESLLEKIDQESQTAELAISSVGGKFSSDLQNVWEKEASVLDTEFEGKRGEFLKSITDRAVKLNIPFEPQADVSSPDVWVNGFRLGLYNSSTNVNAEVERKWSEDQLLAWRKYESSWEMRMETLKTRGRQIDIQKTTEITSLQNVIPVIKQKRAPLEAQTVQIKNDIAKVDEQIKVVDEEFRVRVRPILGSRVVVKGLFDNSGRATFSNLESIQPGSYLIYSEVPGTDGQKVWLRPFELQLLRKNEVVLTESLAEPITKFLR